MNIENELFGELHEQEENGLFGNEHRRQYEAQQGALRLFAVVGQSEQLPQMHGLTRCECGKVYDVDLKANCPECGN